MNRCIPNATDPSTRRLITYQIHEAIAKGFTVTFCMPDASDLCFRILIGHGKHVHQTPYIPISKLHTFDLAVEIEKAVRWLEDYEKAHPE